MNELKEITGDIFEIKTTDAICVTTNGYVTKDGEAVMGRGVAKAAKEKFPGIETQLGLHLLTHGNVPGIFRFPGFIPDIVTFPVKTHWREAADLSLIRQSFYLLDIITRAEMYEEVIIPRPGCGNGQLDWEREVKQIALDYYNPRYYFIHL